MANKLYLKPQRIGNNPVDDRPNEPSAVLQLEDINGGFLTTRLSTSQISTIANPASGLLIFNIDLGQFQYYSGASWITLESNSGGSITSVFGRIGAINSQSGDYNASQITNTPSGNIAATNIQSAINELDNEKLSTSHEGAGGSVHSLVTLSTAGFMSPLDKNKLNGISAGATANQADSYLLNRSNHTGTQDISTINGLQAALDSKASSSSSVTSVFGRSGYVIAASDDYNASQITNTPSGDISSINVQSAINELDNEKLSTSHEGSGGNVHPAVTVLAAGFMSPVDKSKLDGIQNNATANQADSYLLNRSNHTGTQSISTILNLQITLDGKSNIGHIHDISDITSLQTTLDGKSNIGHIHSISDITNLQTTLDNKALAVHTHNASALTSGLLDDARLSANVARRDQNNDFNGNQLSNFAGNVIVSNTTSYNLTNTDTGKVLIFTSSSNVTITIPSGLIIGFNVLIVQRGNGTITISPSGGVSLVNRQNHTRIAGINGVVSLISIDTNIIVMSGDTIP